MRHIHKNGRAISGLHEAAAILNSIMENTDLGFMDVQRRSGVSTQVLDRFIHEHAATMPTIRAIEKAFSITLPMPTVRTFYRGRIIGRRDDGWVYETRDSKGCNVSTCWRQGTREEVQKHLDGIIHRLNQDPRGWSDRTFSRRDDQ